MVRICDFQSHDGGFNSLWKCLNSSSSNGRTSDFGSVNRGSNPREEMLYSNPIGSGMVCKTIVGRFESCTVLN